VPDYPIPASIIADGTTPQGPQIADWLRSIPPATATDPAVIRFAPYGTYCTDQTVNGAREPYTIEVKGLSRFEIHGQASSLNRIAAGGARDDAHLRFIHCNWFSVLHVTVNGAAPRTAGYMSTLEAQHGLDIQSSHHGTFTAVTIDDVWGDKAYLGFDRPGDTPCDTIEFDSCVGGYSHRHSVAITAAENVLSHGCDWGRSARSGVDLEPNSTHGTIINVQFVGDTWGAHRLNWLACAPAHGKIDGVTFTRCASHGSPLSVAVLQRDDTILGAFTVEDCTSDTSGGGNSGAVMNFGGVTGPIRVVGNRQPLQTGRVTGNPYMHCARFTGCTGPIVYSGNMPPDQNP
jgi:hypothetical protein